jgi:lipid A 3-O-deacylase
LKKIAYISLLIVLFVSCKQEAKQHEMPELLVQNDSIHRKLISGPILLIVKSSKSKDIPYSFLRAKALQFKLNLEETNAGSFVFNKKSGNRIVLDIEPDTGCCDYVLFNTIDDPVICSLNDLDHLLTDLFTQKQIAKKPANSVDQALRSDTGNKIYVDEATSLNIPDAELLPRTGKKPRIIPVQVSDNKTELPEYPNIPDINFVIQRVDNRRLLSFSFENDLITYFNTDRYFTNGVTFIYQAPGLGNLKVSRLLFPYKQHAYLDYQLKLVQNMYTPYTTLKDPDLKNDRPYSSFITVSLTKNIKDPVKKLIISNSIVLGYQGPDSPGGYLQTYAHKVFPTNDPPIGWETQLSNDYFLNYNLKIEKSLVSKQRLQLNWIAQANTGSMYDNAGGGFHMLYGLFENPFGYISLPLRPKFQAYLFTENILSGIGYDATLQGGVFHTDDKAALRANSLERFVFSSGTGLHLAWRNNSIEFCQHYLSPEFKGGKWHKWGRVTLALPL